MAKIKSSNLYLFLSALLRHWIPLVTGGGLTALIAIREHLYQKSVWAAYASILIVFFGIASYRLWSAQRAEIARLTVKPYDEDQRRIANSIVRKLSLVERDLLRFLLLHGTTPTSVLNDAALIAYGNFGAMLTKLSRDGLTTREVDEVRGIVTYSVVDYWRPLFRDLLFPREETEAPVLEGL